MIRLATLGVGYGFLVLGIVGLVVPVLQGVLFIVLGLVVLSRHAPWARRALLRLKRRFPRLAGTIARAERVTRRWTRLATVRIGRLFHFANS